MERDRRQREYDLGQIPDPLPGKSPSAETGWAVRPLRSGLVFGQVMLAGAPESEVLSEA